MIINKVKFLIKDKNMQLNNNQNQTKILNLQSWNLNLEEKLELILESSINNQQFVCREKKKKQELEVKTREKKLERIVAALGLENCVMRLPQGWYL